MNSKKQQLANIPPDIDIESPRKSISRSSDSNAFEDVTSFLNIDAKPTTLFELKKEFTSHNLLDDIKIEENNTRTEENKKNNDYENDVIYQTEQFLTFIHSTNTTNDINNNDSIENDNICREYSMSVLSKNIVVSQPSNNKDISTEFKLDEYKNKTTYNAYSDPSNICSQIKWKFGFVKVQTKWRPEFMDVIQFKTFNLKTASKIFNTEFNKPETHIGWQHLYWFFDNRSLDTKNSQKNATSGMKKYLNDYKDGIILRFDNKYNICEYNRKKCLEIISDDNAINKNIYCGILRAYCDCDVVEWKHNYININDKPICMSCKYEYCINENEFEEKKKEKEKEKRYWISGISSKHNLTVYLCGKCIIKLIIEATDRDLIDIYSYLTDSLTNNRKITELCLVHRLFATSSQLMQLLINSFCHYFELNETAGMLKVINFCIKWVNFLWFEDFQKKSKARLLVNKFISFLLEQTNTKNEYLSIYKATQKLIKTYRDQYLLQQQLDAELQSNNNNNNDQITPITHTPNISSKIMLQNGLNNYFSDSQNSEEDLNYFQYDLFNKEIKEIPLDLRWYDSQNNEKKQKFFHYIIQKRNSIENFRKYKSKELQNIKKYKSGTIQIGNNINEIDLSLHKSMPFQSIGNGNNNQQIHTRNSSKSIHIKTGDLNLKFKQKKKKRKQNSDALNVIKSYEIHHMHKNQNKKPQVKTSKSAFAIFGINNSNEKNTQSKFLKKHCRDFAEQFTIIAFDLFRAIRATEFLRKAWTKKDKNISAPNIAELIIFMEAITVWAKFEIAVEISKFRKKTIERICRIGIELLRLRNIYGAVQIYLSLISSDVKWFKNDLQILFDIHELKQFMETIAKLIDGSRNHASLRADLWKLSAPAIPYLGVFLKDAFQADELLKISKLQKVNPKQMELLFNVYDKIELFRNVSYTKIKRNNIIIAYIHRQLHRSKKLNVKALFRFCKAQSIKERSKKGSFWSKT